MRFFRTLVPFVMLGVAGFVVGCSNQPPPPDKETGKRIVEDMKAVAEELKAERAEAKKDRPNMKEMMKDRRRGRGGD
jgi:hypothetical protein